MKQADCLFKSFQIGDKVRYIHGAGLIGTITGQRVIGDAVLWAFRADKTGRNHYFYARNIEKI
jgi:hypothetical protein